MGTYNGNPLGMAAARASLLEVLTPAAYGELERLGERMVAGCERGDPGERRWTPAPSALGSKGCVHWGSDPRGRQTPSSAS